MMISTKGRYALRIMVDVAQHDGEMPVSVREIAQRQDISGKYMEQIMPLLTRAGYVRSYRGNNGGYMLARKPREYTVGEILRTTEGSLAPIPCIEEQPNQCPRKEYCTTLSFWEGLGKLIDEYVDGVTLADLIEKKN